MFPTHCDEVAVIHERVGTGIVAAEKKFVGGWRASIKLLLQIGLKCTFSILLLMLRADFQFNDRM
jgi:hypothetical protein